VFVILLFVFSLATAPKKAYAFV